MLWYHILVSGLLFGSSLIFGGDLNLTLSSFEFWVSGKVLDHLAYYFKNLSEEAKKIDFEPSVMSPTWSNGCVGKVINIAKHLDRFLMFENLRNVLGRFKSWDYSTGVSNHKVVVP